MIFLVSSRSAKIGLTWTKKSGDMSVSPPSFQIFVITVLSPSTSVVLTGLAKPFFARIARSAVSLDLRYWKISSGRAGSSGREGSQSR